MARLTEADRETRLSSAELEGARERGEFRRTFAFVIAAHVIVVFVVGLVAKLQPEPKIEQIQWLDGGVMGGGGDTGAEVEPPPAPELEPPPPPPEPEPPPPPPEPTTDLVVPKATPPPATPTPTPKPETPKPATPKPTPKPTPRATPKPTPKARPKTTPKKSASPKPSSPKPSPKASPGAATSPKPVAKPGTEGSANTPTSENAGASKGPAVGAGKGQGTEGSGPGAGKPSDFGWYFASLRDRYYAVWAPPSVPDSASLVVTLKIRVKRDGTVLGHELVKSSGNSLMDGSVLDAAQQVTKIDPLPPGLGSADVLDIPINFKPE